MGKIKYTFTKKVLFALLLLFACGTIKAQLVEGWKGIQTGVSENLFGICCIDTSTVVACGENGKILKTVDGGISWDVVFEKEGFSMIHVAFADENTGYACGDSCFYNSDNHKGIIVKTLDGGLSWQEIDNTEFVSLDEPDWNLNSKLIVVNAETFYLFDDNSVLWKSTDGGQSFTSYDFELEHVYACEMYFEEEVGFLIVIDRIQFDDKLKIYKSSDEGLTWNMVESFDYSSWYFTFTHFFDKNRIEVYGRFNNDSDNLLVTGDGFETIAYEQLENSPLTEFNDANLHHAKFTSDSYGCVLAGFTFDKGSTDWNPLIMKGDSEHFVCVGNGIPECEYVGTLQCTGMNSLDGVDTTFYIAAEHGYVYKSAMILLTDVEEVMLKNSSVSPNPVMHKISITGEKIKQLELFNQMGKVVLKTHYDEDTDNAVLDMSDLRAGIYFLRVTDAEGNQSSHKVIKE